MHFKESLSVIIPKPGKASYSTPKSFRPIVLLNTLGKLVKKMLGSTVSRSGGAPSLSGGVGSTVNQHRWLGQQAGGSFWGACNAGGVVGGIYWGR
jgi:hypothetical protein